MRYEIRKGTLTRRSREVGGLFIYKRMYLYMYLSVSLSLYIYILSFLNIEKHDIFGGDFFTILFVGVPMDGTDFFYDSLCNTPPPVPIRPGRAD